MHDVAVRKDWEAQEEIKEEGRVRQVHFVASRFMSL